MAEEAPESQEVVTSADCCTPKAIDRDPRIARHFDHRTQQRTAGGVLPEMMPVTRRLLDQLADVREIRPTVLELGCGTGALTVELLNRGAARADGVDLSAESLATARRRAAEAGVDDRVKFEAGDGAQVSLAVHDWVILDRVICCYPDVNGLLGNSIKAAGSRYAFTVPNSRGWRGILARMMVWFRDLVGRLERVPCPGYVHSIDLIEGRLAAAGFSLRSQVNRLWYSAVWERTGSAS